MADTRDGLKGAAQQQRKACQGHWWTETRQSLWYRLWYSVGPKRSPRGQPSRVVAAGCLTSHRAAGKSGPSQTKRCFRKAALSFGSDYQRSEDRAIANPNQKRQNQTELGCLASPSAALSSPDKQEKAMEKPLNNWTRGGKSQSQIKGRSSDLDRSLRADYWAAAAG